VVQAAFQAGWYRLKLYFMIGLPHPRPQKTWTGIAQLARQVLAWGREYRTARKRPEVTVSVGLLCTQTPHRPSQWFGQNPLEVLAEKQEYLNGSACAIPASSSACTRWSTASWRRPFLQGAIGGSGQCWSGPVDLGCQFDGWGDQLRFESWLQAFREAVLDPAE